MGQKQVEMQAKIEERVKHNGMKAEMMVRQSRTG